MCIDEEKSVFEIRRMANVCYITLTSECLEKD